MTAPGLEQPALLLFLDTLGDDAHPERDPHGHDRRRERGGRVLARNPHQERAIDLERVRRQVAQIGEGRVAGPEVVECDAHAERAQTPQRVDRQLGVVQQHVLGDLDAEPRSRGALLGQQRRDALGQAGLAELLR